MEVMIRTLQGQGPRIQSILVGPATKNFKDDISKILDKDCDRNSTGWDNPGMDKLGPKILCTKHSLIILQIQRNTIQNLTNTLA